MIQWSDDPMVMAGRPGDHEGWGRKGGERDGRCVGVDRAVGRDGVGGGREGRETGGAWVWTGLGKEEGSETEGAWVWMGLWMEGKGRETGGAWVWTGLGKERGSETRGAWVWTGLDARARDGRRVGVWMENGGGRPVDGRKGTRDGDF